MKILSPTKVKKIPLSWRQAIAQNENRGFNLTTFFKQFVFSRNPFRNHSVFISDYLILGANPVLNLLILKNILSEIQEKNITTKKIISLITTNSFDYWGYHAFEKEDVWKMLGQDFSIKYKNIEDFFDSEISSLIIPENVELVFVNDKNFSIYSIQKDNFVEGYFLHLVDYKEEKIDIFSHMKTVFKAENNIRSKYYHLFKNFFYKKQTVLDNIAELSFPEKKLFTKDSNVFSHLLCTKEIYLSSITNLIESKNKEETIEIMNEELEVTRFEHWLYSHSVGSTNLIANSFVGLEFLALDDTLKLIMNKNVNKK